MAFRISRFRDANFSDINGTNVWELDTTVYCDTIADLPGMDDINNYHLVIGCRAIVIDTGKKYLLRSNGTWVEDTKSGGGGGGGSVTIDTQVLPDSPNPVQNQAIYAFVNSSVATNTASFQGTYHTLAELEAVQNPTNNDYGFVIDVQSVVLLDTEPADWSTNWTDYYIYDNGEYVPVSGDSAPTFVQNTYYKADGVVYKRYKYNASDEQWEFEYDLNNSSFTAAEWATIQSGLTASDKTTYNNHITNKNNPHEVTKSQVGLGNVDNTSDANKPISTATQNALNSKQDILTAGTGLTIDQSTDTISIAPIPNLTAGTEKLYTIAFNAQGQIISANEVTSLTLNCVSDGLDGTPETYFNTMKAFFDKNNAENMTPQELTDLAEQWYLSTRENWNGWTTFEETGSSYGTRGGDNVGMTCTPSTDSTAGTDDFAGLPLFYPIDVNFIIDNNGETLITAIDGITSNFERDNPDKFVGVMQQSAYHWESHTSSTYTHGYSSNPVNGKDYCSPLPECSHKDGSFKQFMVHSKYQGAVVNDKLVCCSGLIPTAWMGVDNSHIYAQANGEYYGAESITQLAFLQLMSMIKYASMTQDGINQGCINYNYQYVARVAESGVKRILITTTQASNLVVGSSLLIGTVGSSNNIDRGTASMYSISGQKGCLITSIENVEIDSTTYAAVYVNTDSTFNTIGNGTVSTGNTIISTFAWKSGTNDNVLGNDGSKESPSSGKYPAKIQGIEYSVGIYETYGDIIINTHPADATRTNGYISYHVVDDVKKRVTSGNYTSDYMTLNFEVSKPTATAEWNYIVKNNFNLGVCCPANITDGSSTSFTRDAMYTLAKSSSVQVTSFRSFGSLVNGSGNGGLSRLYASSVLGSRHWFLGARLSACGFWSAYALHAS